MNRFLGGGPTRTMRAGVLLRFAGVSILALGLANCASGSSTAVGRYDGQQSREFGAFKDKRYGAASPRVIADGQAIPKGGGRDQTGRPYVINGKVYRPYQKPDGFTQTGSASWYGAAFHGRKTANGEIYDRHSFTAAHPTMPLPSYARVTNLRNGYSIVVRVNDRGPYHGGRIIDLSERTAEALDFKSTGTARVNVAYIGRASLAGSDDRQLLASLRTDGAPASFDGGTNVASADPVFTPKTRRAPEPRVAVATRGTLPGLEPAPRIEINTLSDAAPTVGSTTLKEPQIALAPPVSNRQTAFVAADTTAPQPLAAAFQSGDGSDGTPSADSASESLSSLYYAEPDVAAQPAAAWKIKPASRQPIAEPKLLQDGAFRISAGIFRKMGNAERLARTLDGDAPVTVTKIELDGAVAYAVVVGPIGNADEAQAMLRRARDAGATGAKLRRG
jgi:rare lipoprotein A